MPDRAKPLAEFDLLQEQFQEQGYILLKGFLPDAVVAGCVQALQRLVDREAQSLLAKGKIVEGWEGEPFETRLYRLYEGCLDDAPKSFRPELHLPELFPLFFHSGLLDIVERFLGGEIRLYPNYTARPKLPGWDGTQVLWHQDGGYTEKLGQDDTVAVEQFRMVNVWTPLVPVDAHNGCMQFIPGTHRLGVVPHETRKHYLEISETYLKPRLSEAVDIVCDPGDVVLFHNLLFHQGQPNASDSIRWSIDWRYQDAEQSTRRKERGHIARSRSHPEAAVQDAEQWSRLSFQ